MPRLKPETMAARRKQILTASLVCFADKGYHQATMDDVVREAGISKGGLYVHFSSKKELFSALLEWYVEEIGFFAPPTPSTSPRESLQHILHQMLSTVSSDTFRSVSILLTEIWAQNNHAPDIKETATRFYAKVRQPLTEIIKTGITDGTFKPVDATATANILIAIFEGLIIQFMIDENAVDWDAVSEVLNLTVARLLYIES